MLCASAQCLAAAVSENVLTFSENDACTFWGNSKSNEVYDIAVRIDDSALTGKKIKGFTVPVSNSESLSQTKGWLASELAVASGAIVADIASADAAVVKTEGEAYPLLSVEFAEPFVMTNEPVYVGYSLKTAKTEGAEWGTPIALLPGIDPSGLFVHSSRTYLKWTDCSEKLQGVSAMRVVIEGEFGDYAVSLGEVGSVTATIGENTAIAATFINHGKNEVSDVTYTYSIGDYSAEGSFTLTTPLSNRFGSRANVMLPIVMPDFVGDYDIVFSVTKANGQQNAESGAVAVGKAKILPFWPVNRPLMEEYTGTWCGWCPRGYVALEEMKALYGTDFVAASYHVGDDHLATITELPNRVATCPKAFMNRSIECDPFYGDTDSKYMGIENLWKRLREPLATADIKVEIEWEDEAKTMLKVKSTTRFTEDWIYPDFRVSYIVIADGITKLADTSRRLKQSNYFSGSTLFDRNEYKGELWDLFFDGPEEMTDLTYNDIVLKYDDLDGVEGRLPNTIAANTPIEHSTTIDCSSFPTNKGFHIDVNPDKIRVIAVLTQGGKEQFINCASSGYTAASSISEVAADGACIKSVNYYDLMGRPVAKPASGNIYLRKATMTDGTTTVKKLILR